MKFSEYISESEMQTLLRKKLALEAKLQKTKRNANRQKIIDDENLRGYSVESDNEAIWVS